VTRFDILKGKISPPKKPVLDFSRPFPGLTTTIIIAEKTYQGHITNLSYTDQIGLAPQKRGTLIILPKDEGQVSEILGMINLLRNEITFYAHGVDQPQKMFVEECHYIDDPDFLSMMKIELTGTIL
jgi:hypothetical protein